MDGWLLKGDVCLTYGLRPNDIKICILIILVGNYGQTTEQVREVQRPNNRTKLTFPFIYSGY